MVDNWYKIGCLKLQICIENERLLPKNLKKFRIDKMLFSEESDIEIQTKKQDCCLKHRQEYEPGLQSVRYVIELTEALPEILEQCMRKQNGKIVQRKDATVFSVEHGECRFLRFPGTEQYYGISFQETQNTYHIWFDRKISGMLSADTVFWSAFQLERQAIQTGALILHAAYICYEGQAILFSADSGVGKSTQASLWETYRNAKIINGDRCLLMRDAAGWKAGGWPVCGSSGICCNETYPVCAIVMLEQSQQNSCRHLGGMEAFRTVFPQITVNGWNREYQIQAMDCLEELIGHVAVCELRCDISEAAVCCLEEYLKGDR